MNVLSFIVVAMETKVVSEPRGAEVESEPGAEFQPLLWDVDVGRRLCTGTVVAYLSLFALVTSSLHTCGNPDSTQKSSCFGAAAMMLTAFAMTRLPWRREKNEPGRALVRMSPSLSLLLPMWQSVWACHQSAST